MTIRQKQIDKSRMENGEFPSFAWPGGYPLIYIVGSDCGILCPDCANGMNGSDASLHTDDNQWKIVDAKIYYEGPPILCDHCNALIESACGDPLSDSEHDC